MKVNFLLAFCMLAFSADAISQKSNRIAKMKWLAGSWQGTYSGGPFYESWRVLKDGTLINFTISITKTDTVVKENGLFREIDKEIFFIGSDARWKLIELTDSSITLANDTLKYANKIVWSHSKDDHWLTYIKNPKNEIRYDLIKVKWLERHIDAFLARRPKEK